VELNTLALEIEGPVATVTLNRPDKANAISEELRAELEAVLNELNPGDAVRVIRLRGAGRGFSAGYDLSSTASVYALSDKPGTSATAGAPAAELGESQISLDRERVRTSIERWLRMWNYRKPIVAQVHGFCLGGGLDLLGACDIAFAAEDAKFGHAAARGLGIPPTLGHLPLKIGPARTKELLFTGDSIDGKEAERWGLVNHAVAADALDSRTNSFCHRIALEPLDALTLHKHVTNRWLEVIGLRLAVLEGAEFNSLFHQAPASVEFGRVLQSEGLRAALAWRDGPFDTAS
jgi:enoyl-CoA hydratase